MIADFMGSYLGLHLRFVFPFMEETNVVLPDEPTPKTMILMRRLLAADFPTAAVPDANWADVEPAMPDQ